MNAKSELIQPPAPPKVEKKGCCCRDRSARAAAVEISKPAENASSCCGGSHSHTEVKGPADAA